MKALHCIALHCLVWVLCNMCILTCESITWHYIICASMCLMQCQTAPPRGLCVISLCAHLCQAKVFICTVWKAQHCILCKCLQSPLIKAHTSSRMKVVCSSAMRRACSPHIQSTSFLFPVKSAELCNDRGKDCNKVVEWHADVHTAYQQEETGTNYPSGGPQVGLPRG